MTRYLFLVSSGKLDNGALVVSRQLSEALARGHDVHLATIGPCEQSQEGLNVVELDQTLLSQEATDDIEQTQPFVDRFSKTIRAVVDEQGLEQVGLPTDAGAFDVIIGTCDVTGPAALHLRDTHYPDSKVATILPLDLKGFYKTIDEPEAGAHRIKNNSEILARSDLILGLGPKSARDGAELASEWPEIASLPAVHDFVPGIEPTEETPARWQKGDPFNVLMLGRMDDPNKGAVDAVLGVHEMRENGYENAHLTLRGVGTEGTDEYVDRLNEWFPEGQWQSFVTVQEFTGDEAEMKQSISESQVLLVATESESYGLVAGEYAAHGKPLVVAEGYGNGFATLLRDEQRIQSDIGDRFVLNDSGSVSANGALFGEEPEGDGKRVNRYNLIADRLEDVHDNYDTYLGTGQRLRNHFSEYSREDTAAGIDQAANAVMEGGTRHTKQGPRGELLETGATRVPLVSAEPTLDTPEQPPREQAAGQRGPASTHDEPHARRVDREGRSQAEPAAGEAPERKLRGAEKAPKVRKRELPGADQAQEAPRRDQRKAKEAHKSPKRTLPTAEGAPGPSKKPQAPEERPVEESERHQDPEPENPARTSSAVWGTAKPSFGPMAERRAQWGQYDDRHGYGRLPRVGSVRMPDKGPGPYAKLLHPNTAAAYERDQQQAKQGEQGHSK